MPYSVSSKAKEPYVIWMDSSIDLRDQGYDEVDRSGVYVLWIVHMTSGDKNFFFVMKYCS